MTVDYVASQVVFPKSKIVDLMWTDVAKLHLPVISTSIVNGKEPILGAVIQQDLEIPLPSLPLSSLFPIHT